MAAWTAASDALRSSRSCECRASASARTTARAAARTLEAALLQPVAPFDPLACRDVVVLDDAQSLELGHELRPDVSGSAPEPSHEGLEILPVLHQGAGPARAGACGEDRERSPSAKGLVQEALDRGSGLDGAPRREMDVVRHDEEARSLGRRREVRGHTRGGRRSRRSRAPRTSPGPPAGRRPRRPRSPGARPLRGQRTPRGSSREPAGPWESTTTASTVVSSTRLGNTGGWSCPVLGNVGRATRAATTRSRAKLVARSSSVSTQPRARRPPRSRSADDAPPR